MTTFILARKRPTDTQQSCDAASWLGFAASPTFALMAWISANDMQAMMWSPGPGILPIGKPLEETMVEPIRGDLGVPKIVDRATFQADVDALRIREKAHTREGDAIAAARRRLSMVKVDGATPLIGESGPVTLSDAFEGRRLLIAYYFMWYTGRPASEQCEGCTFFTSQVRELSTLHANDATYATFCQGPYEESARYRDFMGWELPWYSAPEASLEALLAGRKIGTMYLICYLRQGSDVFETYWTTLRGVEAMDNNYRLLDLTVYGRQQSWEDSPSGWPQIEEGMSTDTRPTAQWPRLKAGYSDDLGADNSRRCSCNTSSSQ